MNLVDRVVILHEALDVLDIPHAIGGALSLGYHAEPRGTVEIDLDIFLPPSREDFVVSSLIEIGVEKPAPPTSIRIPTQGIQCPWGDTHIDLFFAYDDEFFNSVRERVETHPFRDSRRIFHDLPFLSAEDLTIFKISFNRPKDWVDIEAMLRQAPLDYDYVEKWLLHLRGETVWPKLRRFLDLCDQVVPGLIEPEGPE